MKGSTGVSMQGQIIDTKKKSKEQKRKYYKKVATKKKLAEVCLECESNQEGFCNKYKGWCSKVNYRCNGYEMSFSEYKYQEQLKQQRNRRNKRKSKTKKLKQKKNKVSD